MVLPKTIRKRGSLGFFTYVNLSQAKLQEEMRQAKMKQALLEKKAQANEAVITELKVFISFCFNRI